MKNAKEYKEFLNDLDRQSREIEETRKAVKADYISDCSPVEPGDKVRIYRKVNTAPGLSLDEITSGKRQHPPKFEEVHKPAFINEVLIDSKNNLRITFNKVKADGTESKLRDYADHGITKIEIIEKSKK